VWLDPVNPMSSFLYFFPVGTFTVQQGQKAAEGRAWRGRRDALERIDWPQHAA